MARRSSLVLPALCLAAVFVAGCRSAPDIAAGYMPPEVRARAAAARVPPTPVPDAGSETPADPAIALQAFSEFLRSLSGFRVRIVAVSGLNAQGALMSTVATCALSVARPNRIAMAIEGSEGSALVVSDGRWITTYDRARNQYVTEPAPSDLDGLLLDGGSSVGATSLPAMTVSLVPAAEVLLGSRPDQALLRGADESVTATLARAGGSWYHRIQASGRTRVVEAWVRAEEPHLLVALDVRSRRPAESKAGRDASDLGLGLHVYYADWRLNPEQPREEFVFDAPEGAVQVAPSFGSLSGQPHALLGKKAPPFDLELLSGGRFSLSERLGRHIVVLNFWATWCTPCRRELPLLWEAIQNYANEGVEFCAVNVSESADVVAEYLSAQGLACPVALDLDGNVAEAYELDSLPQTVVIGTDRNVQAVHVGYVPGGVERIRGQIDALLAGRDLLAEAVRR